MEGNQGAKYPGRTSARGRATPRNARMLERMQMICNGTDSDVEGCESTVEGNVILEASLPMETLKIEQQHQISSRPPELGNSLSASCSSSPHNSNFLNLEQVPSSSQSQNLAPNASSSASVSDYRKGQGILKGTAFVPRKQTVKEVKKSAQTESVCNVRKRLIAKARMLEANE